MAKIKQCGVYKITCLCNGKIYIGSSNNIFKRWEHHRWALRHNEHNNKYLQNAWNKYGEENFRFEIVELCTLDKQFDLEQKYLDELKPFIKLGNGYNFLENAGDQRNKSRIEFTAYDDIGFPHKIKERDCLVEMLITYEDYYKSKRELQNEYDSYIAMTILHDDMVMCNPDYE